MFLTCLADDQQQCQSSHVDHRVSGISTLIIFDPVLRRHVAHLDSYLCCVRAVHGMRRADQAVASTETVQHVSGDTKLRNGIMVRNEGPVKNKYILKGPE